MEFGGYLFKFFALLLPLLADFQLLRVRSRRMCNREIIIWGNQTYTWEHTGDSDTDLMVSEPPCLRNGQIVARKCLGGQWNPPNFGKCDYIPEESSADDDCPEDLVKIPNTSTNFCFKISNRTVEWSDRICLGTDATVIDLKKHDRDAITEYLRLTKQIKSFWIPVRRANDNIYNPFIWMLPGKLWGETLNDVLVNNELSDKRCLIINNYLNTTNVSMSHCNAHHHSVCVFRRKSLAIKSVCPQNYGALSYKPNICYGIQSHEETSVDVKQLSIREYFENRNAIRQILNLVHNDEDFTLNSINFNDEKYDLLINNKGHIKTRPALPFTRYLGVRVMKDPGTLVELFLKFDAELDNIVLTVYNGNLIWRLDEDDHGIKCFTNADNEAISPAKIKDVIWQNSDPINPKTMYELKMYGNGPGYYWCEAHTLYNFTLVKTKKLVAQKKNNGHTFATFLDMPFDMKTFGNIYSNRKKLSNQAKQLLKNLKNIDKESKEKYNQLKIHSVRVMNIESIKEDFSSLSALCHISASLKNSAVDDSDEVSSEEIDEKEDNRGIRHDTAIRMTVRSHLIEITKLHNANSSSVNSTEFCFPEILPDNPRNHWSTAKIGETSTTKLLCLQKNGLPVSRKCIGDFLYGATWKKIDSKHLSCIQNIPPKLITNKLYEIDHSIKNSKGIENDTKYIKSMIRRNVNNLIPADLFYLGKILRCITTKVMELRSMAHPIGPLSLLASNVKSLLKSTTSDIICLYNYLMKVKVGIMKKSVVLNSTNILLDAFETLIDEISTTTELMVTGTAGSKHRNDAVEVRDDENGLIENINYNDGVVVHSTSKLIVFVMDPKVANITGLAIYKSKAYKSRGMIDDNHYRFLHSNQSIEELLEEDDLQFATFFPDTLLDNLDEISIQKKNKTSADLPDLRVVIKIFRNDNLFQQDLDIVDKKVYSQIVSISIPGHDRDLPELLPLIVRNPSNMNVNNTTLRYWDYSSWASDGIVFLGKSKNNSNLMYYGSSHLTPYSLLLQGSYNLTDMSDDVVITEIHREALDIITLTGCSLSLIGVMGIFITALIFQTWRKKASSRVLLQLSLAIALQMVLFCFVNTEDYTSHLISNHIFSSCIALGACLQYSVLVQFCWMMIIAYLQYTRYVTVIGNNRPKHFFIKSFLIGWGIPLIPVLLVILFDQQSYIPRQSSGYAICYPSGISLYFGICLPVALVILGNLFIFIKIIYSISRESITIETSRHHDKRRAMAQIRVSILMFFLLGVTWIFGLLTVMKAGILFSYLFSITATVQGFVLFVYFILLDPATRSMWRGYFRKVCSTKKEQSSKNTTNSF